MAMSKKQHIENLERFVGTNGKTTFMDCSILVKRVWKAVQGWLDVSDGNVSLVTVGEKGELERYNSKTRVGFAKPIHC